MAQLYIVQCSTLQCSAAVKEEKLSRPSVEYEVPRELLLHRDQLMPPLEFGFERFAENILIVQPIQNRRRRRNNGTVQLAEGMGYHVGNISSLYFVTLSMVKIHIALEQMILKSEDGE